MNPEVIRIPAGERLFLRWIVGSTTSIAIIVGGTVGTLLWQLNTQVATILVDTRNLKDTVSSMQNSMNLATSYRYTSQDAIQDRNTLLKILDGQGLRLTDVEKEQVKMRLDFEKHVSTTR